MDSKCRSLFYYCQNHGCWSRVLYQAGGELDLSELGIPSTVVSIHVCLTGDWERISKVNIVCNYNKLQADCLTPSLSYEVYSKMRSGLLMACGIPNRLIEFLVDSDSILERIDWQRYAELDTGYGVSMFRILKEKKNDCSSINTNLS